MLPIGASQGREPRGKGLFQSLSHHWHQKHIQFKTSLGNSEAQVRHKRTDLYLILKYIHYWV